MTFKPAPFTKSEYVITDCPDHGVKVVEDWHSFRVYVELARACEDDRFNQYDVEHTVWHAASGHECWVCCDMMRINPHEIGE